VVNLTQKEVENMAAECGDYIWRNGADGAIVNGSLSGLIGEPTFKDVIAKDKWTKVSERKRTYHFVGGVATSVENASWLWVSSGGTHYICEANGTIHIIAKGWFRITITE
jgi:hypothetical protein